MGISVIIVNWNTKRLLEDCIRSVIKFTKDLSYEIIVVDNGSTDRSPELIKKKYPKIKLIENKENLGFTKANNQGIKVAKGEYVFLLNSDAYLIENSLKKLIDLAKSKENLGALGPLLLNPDRSTQQSVGFFPHLPQMFFWLSFLDDLPLGQFLNPYHVDHDSFYKSGSEVDWVTGAAYLLPAKVIKEVGFLDEKIFMYGEEVEWSYRIKKAGYKIFFSPATKIVHIGRGSSSASTNAIVGEFKGVIYFYKKHKGFLALQIARIFLKIGALARIVIFALMGRSELAKSYVQAFKVG